MLVWLIDRLTHSLLLVLGAKLSSLLAFFFCFFVTFHSCCVHQNINIFRFFYNYVFNLFILNFNTVSSFYKDGFYFFEELHPFLFRGMYIYINDLNFEHLIFVQWRVDDLSFFDYLSPFCFLLIEFHCIFSISFKIIHFMLLILCFD